MRLDTFIRCKANIVALEQMDISHPLIQKLREKAPGTFVHSCRVANLAVAAAVKMGLDPTIICSAALFHDIGKIENDHSFVEAQSGDRSTNHPISSREHLDTILNHPQRSAKILEERSFPKIIIDIVRNHHGTTKCLAQLSPSLAGVVGEVRYKGTPPQSKLEALLMIADQFEAILNGQLNGKENLTRNDIQRLTTQVLGRVWGHLTKKGHNQMELSGMNLSHCRLIEDAFCEALCKMHSVPSQKISPQQSSAPAP